MTSVSNSEQSRQATPSQTEQVITRATATVEQIMNLPLGQVLTGLDVEVFDSSVTDNNFCGGVVVRDGRITVLNSPDRDTSETEYSVRYLTAQALNLDISDLRSPFGAEYVDITKRVNISIAEKAARP